MQRNTPMNFGVRDGQSAELILTSHRRATSGFGPSQDDAGSGKKGCDWPVRPALKKTQQQPCLLKSLRFPALPSPRRDSQARCRSPAPSWPDQESYFTNSCIRARARAVASQTPASACALYPVTSHPPASARPSDPATCLAPASARHGDLVPCFFPAAGRASNLVRCTLVSSRPRGGTSPRYSLLASA
jgi:hypothetical protein